MRPPGQVGARSRYHYLMLRHYSPAAGERVLEAGLGKAADRLLGVVHPQRHASACEHVACTACTALGATACIEVQLSRAAFTAYSVVGNSTLVRTRDRGPISGTGCPAFPNCGSSRPHSNFFLSKARSQAQPMPLQLKTQNPPAPPRRRPPWKLKTSNFLGSLPSSGVKVISSLPGPGTTKSVARYWSPKACLCAGGREGGRVSQP